MLGKQLIVFRDINQAVLVSETLLLLTYFLAITCRSRKFVS